MLLHVARSLSLFALLSALLSPRACAQGALEQAVARANALREQAEAALQGKDPAAAKQGLREALAGLDKAAGADEDAGVAYARWLLAKLAFALGDKETEAATWAKVAAYYRKFANGEPKWAREALRNQAAALGRLTRESEALPIQQQLLAEYKADPSVDPKDLLAVRWDLAVTLGVLNRAPEAVAIWEEILAQLRARQPLDEDELLTALGNYAVALESALQSPKSETVAREVLARLEALGRQKTRAYADARVALAWCVQHQGRPKEAVTMLRAVISEFDVPEQDPLHWELRARLGYALRHADLDAEALPILEQAHARLMAFDPPNRGAQLWLANALAANGERRRGIDMMADLYEHGRQQEPAHSTVLLDYARALAGMWRAEGDLERARQILEQALQTYESSTLPNDSNPNDRYQLARLALGDTLRQLGDAAGALRIYEQVLALRERFLADDDSKLNVLRRAIAGTRFDLGDFVGARPMYEKVHDVLRATRPGNDLELNNARIDLARCLYWLGDVDACLDHTRQAVTALAASVAPDHDTLRVARFNLAVALARKGEHAEAERLLAQVLDAPQRQPPSGSLRFLAEGELGYVAWRQGDAVRGERLLRAGVAGLDGLPAGVRDSRDDLHAARLRRYLLLLLAGRGEAIAAELNPLLRSVRLRLRDVVALSPRETSETAAVLRRDLDAALSVAPVDSPQFEASLFAIAETLRALAGPPEVDRFFAGGSALANLREQALRARQRLNDLVAGGQDEERPATTAEAVAAACRDRDRAERELRAAMGRPESADVTAEQVFEVLDQGSAAVTFLRYARWSDAQRTGEPSGTPWLLAWVLTSDRRLQRIDLGSADQFDALVTQWRAAIGQPIVRGRPVGEAAAPKPAELGKALRQKILDPVFAKTGARKKLFVCLDGALHLLPLDALPIDGAPSENGLVGHQRELMVLPSLRALVAPQKRSTPAPALLAVGGVAFNATMAGRFTEAAPNAERGDSGPGGQTFRPLPGTLEEVHSLGALYRETFRADAQLRVQEAATKAEFLKLCVGVRWLHLATHGYFAPDVAPLSATTASGAAAFGFGEAVRGLAPLTLCGLALAGANRGRDSLGRVPGILTAEELAGLDLRRCELAVLSACETNVGIERAGQGIQSLQAALHAAGVATAITSLWQVRDEAARDLMLDFYQRLWVQKKTPARALWEAKLQLRKRGSPERDWAGWVLTGRR